MSEGHERKIDESDLLLSSSPVGCLSDPEEVRAWLRRLTDMRRENTGEPSTLTSIARAEEEAEMLLDYVTALRGS